MAYSNPFFYNRDRSSDAKYFYLNDLSSYKPIYGSSVSFSSRLNFIQTIDNSLKILPASENNLNVRYNLLFMLNDVDSGNLLATIEVAGANRYLKFKDPSGLYKDVIGLVEDYDISKTSKNLTTFKITCSSYVKAPIFNWRTSSILDNTSANETVYKVGKSYKKYDFIYTESYDRFSQAANKKIDPKVYLYKFNKIDNFWFAKNDLVSTALFDETKWSQNFIFENQLPFNLQNKLDFYQVDYRNSFIQNIKHRENSNVLKDFNLKYDNIDDVQCRSMLFFLEKKCGYRRFVYEFPIFLKKNKVFICTEWSHIFKYKNCHEINVKFVEDPNPNVWVDPNNPERYFTI